MKNIVEYFERGMILLKENDCNKEIKIIESIQKNNLSQEEYFAKKVAILGKYLSVFGLKKMMESTYYLDSSMEGFYNNLLI